MNEVSKSQRAIWGSKVAFILAATGSAIGLGNIWRFPMMVGRNGGAVFVLVYVLAVALIGFTVMLAELTIGRHTQKNPVGAFEHIKPGTAWKAIGYLGVVTAVAILSYYSVVAGWAIGYVFKTAGGAFRRLGGAEAAAAATSRAFDSFVSNPLLVLVLLMVMIGLTAFIVSRGVREGIERWSKILMPLLFIIVIILAARALTLPGARAGLSFYLRPDFSKLNGTVILFAVGQAFFSLSLGLGTMLTYGSYIRKSDNLVSSAAWVSFSDFLIAFLAGIIIFPTLFAIPGIAPEEGPALVFKVLPLIFAKIPLGQVFGVLFFILLILAALTSTISILEVPVAYLVDEKKWSRGRAAWLVGLLAFVLGIPSALSAGGSSLFTRLRFQDRMDFIFGSIALAVGALLIAVFTGYVWKARNAAREIRSGAPRFRLERPWSLAI
ncbi:MAG: sodium-dependent transporter, partial [Candidatus Aminicenantes bacterium]|nr:sodium-dependent transporter [Candidatus Aminicenantes bacterium]